MSDDDPRKYCVYMHTNKINGKKYIGITKLEPEKRWENGRGYSYNTHFWNAIKKYGWNDGFNHEILFNGLTQEEARQKEIDLIAFYDSTNTDKGYNISSGGDIGKSKQIPVLQYSLDGNFIKEWESATIAGEALGIKRRNITECCLDKNRRQSGGYIWMYKGDEIKEECQEYYLNRFSRPVLQYSLDGEFIARYDSVKNAGEAVDANMTNIIQCCSGNQKTSSGFIWIYEGDELNIESHISNSTRSVIKLSLDGKFIERYNSAKEAAYINGIKSASEIINCCRGKLKTSHGFKWMYECEDNNRKEINTTRINGNKYPVLKFSLDGKILKEYESMTEAACKEKQSVGNMSNVCVQRNEKQTLGGYIFMYKDDYERNGFRCYKDKSKRKIDQYDLGGNYIQTFDSIKDAVLQTPSVPDISKNPGANIIAVCKGRQKTAYGYIWRYADEEE